MAELWANTPAMVEGQVAEVETRLAETEAMVLVGVFRTRGRLDGLPDALAFNALAL